MSQATELIARQMAAGSANARVWADILYNVKLYGAKGDWNGTTGTDDTASVQATIDAAIAAGGKAVFFPHGTYKVTALTNLSSVVLFGDNASFSGISDTISQIGNASSNLVYNVKDYGAKGDGVTNDAAAITSALAAMPSTGGILYFPTGNYLINSTITLNKQIIIEGSGFSTILTGSANPIIATDNDVTHKLILRNLKLVTTGANDGVYINKTWTAGAVSSFEIDRVWFHAAGNAGSLLKIYGARESGVSNCWFTSVFSFAGPAGSAIGVNLMGDNLGGAMNIDFTGCKFYYLYRGVYGLGPVAHPEFFAGFRFNNCMFIALAHGIELYNGGSFMMGDSMLDFTQWPIRLEFWGGTIIHDNYIALQGAASDAIIIVPVGGTSYDNKIMDNQIVCYTSYTDAGNTARGIVLDGTIGGGQVIRTMIKNNTIQSLKTAVYVQGVSGALPGYANEIEGNHIRLSANGINFDTFTVNNQAYNNYFDTVTNPISDAGTRNRIKSNLVNEIPSDNSGLYSVASTNATYTYSFPHGLYTTPTFAVVNPATTPTRDAGAYSISFNATNINVNFANPTAAGLALSWSWMAEYRK